MLRVAVVVDNNSITALREKPFQVGHFGDRIVLYAEFGPDSPSPTRAIHPLSREKLAV